MRMNKRQIKKMSKKAMCFCQRSYGMDVEFFYTKNQYYIPYFKNNLIYQSCINHAIACYTTSFWPCYDFPKEYNSMSKCNKMLFGIKMLEVGK